ncbi:synaptotagmin-like protein 5 [Dysidea avara]|uniref:synaptotagmin-like protein 5 n=1 Tax=Dysidea avara TaxID=196820 RepID=UPI0033329381
MSDCDSISQIVRLISLTKEEEEAIRSVIEEELRLQQDEDDRLKQLRDDIDNLERKYEEHKDDTSCSYCGVQFGMITNRGASCPICEKRVCKQHRLYGSSSDSWMCTLCDMRKRLHINEEVLDACVADVFYVSFTDEPQDYNVKEQQCFEHLQQSKEKPQHRQRLFGSKQQQRQQKVEGKGNHTTVRSPTIPKHLHQTLTTKKQPQSTMCLNITKPKITNITKSLLRSSIKRSSSYKGSNSQTTTQEHSVTDDKDETDVVTQETPSPLQDDKKSTLDKEEDESLPKNINHTGNGKKATKLVHIGELRVMIQFAPKTSKSAKEKGRGSLNVWIQQARGLQTSCDQGTYLQCTVLPRKKYEKFKSAVVQCGSNPTYNTMYQFDRVTNVELSYDRVLEITIWEPHRNSNEFVGGVRLGPKPQPGIKNKWMDSVGSEVSQWEMMMADPNQWIDAWHPLRCLIRR